MVADSQRLAAVVDPLGQVVRGLTEPCPVRSAIEAADRPGVWTGRAADQFRGWLQAVDVFIVRQLAPAVEDVRKWLVHRAGELDDYERSVAAAAAGVPPPLPAQMGLPGPGTVSGYEPYRGPASGFVGLDPGGLRLVVTCLQGAAQSIDWHGRFAEERMVEVEVLVPSDWRAALGRQAFTDSAGWLTSVAKDLSERARRTEEAYAVGALFGSAVPTLAVLAARAASSAAVAVEPLVAKSGVPAPPAPVAEPPAVAEGRAAYERAKELEAARAAGNDNVNEELMAISDRVAFDAAFKAGYMEGYDRDARAAGAACAAQLVEALNQPGCANRDFDRLAGILEARQLSDAYAAGFIETLGPGGLERFAARVQECWSAESGRLADADDRLYGPLGYMLAAASRRPGFDLTIVTELTDGFPEDWERLFQHGAFSTEVSLHVARNLIPEGHWYGFDERDRVGTGLLVLSRNPEAAHLYATAHPDALTRHAEARWQGALAVGTEGFSLTDLAGSVLRIGLLDYPRSLANSTPGGGAGAELVGLTEQAATAAGEARNAATRAMNRIVAQVGDGAKLSHDGRVALAALFADRIPALAAALKTGAAPDLDAKAKPGEEERVEAEVQDVQDCLNQIVADPDARLIFLAGLDESVTDWAGWLATQVGKRFATHPGDPSSVVIGVVANNDDVDFPGGNLGTLLSQVAVALRKEVKDAKERAAQMAGMLNFAVSQGLDAASKGVAAATTPAVGIVAKFGADRVKELAKDHIQALTEFFADVDGKQNLEDAFIKHVSDGMEDVMSAALWSDPQVRARLLATPGFEPPSPRFLDADGNLRPPPPNTEEYGQYRRWLEGESVVGEQGLRGMARNCLEVSGLTDQFYRGLATTLFTE